MSTAAAVITAQSMLKALAELNNNRQIRPLDYQFARFISEMDDNPLLALAAALVSFELGQGNVCLNLDQLDKASLFGLDAATSSQLLELAGIEDKNWYDSLCSCSPVSTPSDGSVYSAVYKESHNESDNETNSRPTPLVLDQNRLYLYRYWLHENSVASHLGKTRPIPVDTARARTILDRLFQRDYAFLHKQLDRSASDEDIRLGLSKWLDVEAVDQVDWQRAVAAVRQSDNSTDLQTLDDIIPLSVCLNWQKVAAALAACQSFSVISGGPGTGKTTTVTRLLAMLVELGMDQGKIPEIRLVAPTGKASARLTESIGGALTKLNCSQDVKALIPSQAGTIHRLLGVIPNQPGFRHHADNRLHLDILVVDEASMIDLPLMNRLLQALPPNARVILLGDRDQLASVEAGSVLGDICAAADGGYSPDQMTLLENLTGFSLHSHLPSCTALNASSVNDSFCLLKKSYRFDALSGIGKLAAAVNSGSQAAVKDVWRSGYTDIRQHPVDQPGYQGLLKLCVNGYRPYLKAIQEDSATDETKRQILSYYNQFRLLCALREGRFGVDGLNREIRQALARRGLVPAEGLWYAGRPVLITQNDHSLGLYNGDIGITLLDDDGRFRVVFELPDGSLKLLLPSRLPQHETVFAMTIHKSQGSEFHHTAIVLPDAMNPVLTRELVYTGITRAKEKLDLFASGEILAGAICNPTMRSSGLWRRLLSH